MLNKSNKQWSAKRLVNEMNAGNIDFNCSVQRSLVWDTYRKSLLIHSMMEDYPIPAFYFVKDDTNKHCALDGKQRSHAIYDFMMDKLSLSEETPFVTLDDGTEYDVNSCKFSNLPDELQQKIRDFSLTIYYFDGITDDEVSELFFRLNNGKPLSAIELTRVRAKSLEAFQEIANHPAVQFAISEKGKANHYDELSAMQMWTICFSETPSFILKPFRASIEKVEVKTSECVKIKSLLDSLHKLYQQYDPETKEDAKILRKMKARTHIVSLVYMAKLCEERGILDDFCVLAHKFFSTTSTGTSIDEAYNRSAGVGSAKPESVRSRMEAISRHIERGLR